METDPDRDVSKVLTASIIRAGDALMMEAVSTFETPVNFYQTTRYNIPEDCQLQEKYATIFFITVYRLTCIGST
jgi:hypothetical protein